MIELEREASAAESEARASEVVFRVRLPGPEAVWFDGHFPGFAILPAVAQVEAVVLPAIRSVWPELVDPRRLVRLKFQRRFRPHERLRLRLAREAEAVGFSLTVADGQVGSSGRIEFAAPGELG